MKHYIDLLYEIPLFQNINKTDMDSMLTCLKPYGRFYKKGNYITHAGDNINSIGVVLSGTVQMLKEDVWGNTAILAIIPEKEIFGETFVCSRSYNSTVSFRAAGDCEILFLSFDKILHSCTKACQFHHRLIDNMVTQIALKNMQLMEKVEIISKKTLREKILVYLSRQAQQSKKLHFTVPMGRMELADYLGADRSALSRELSRMKEEGLIDYHKSTFRLYQSLEH
ncbi:MAG: Crp/Fnr family transcriptional regulator [Syntrophomonadaceae bacterium]|jgi:CRP-like cAMP-binding protein|nr:Crp/Fnr family transcriptional regulator [Syntrophomonadaceae bacterium]